MSLPDLKSLQRYNWYKLEHPEQIRSFECTDKDLNDFLHNDAVDYLNQLMGVTYIVVDESNDDTRLMFFDLKKILPQ